ncbi:EF-hand domain-containing protein [Salinicola sp. MH3R3-1]|uniref:EF-hand domain-containing protein n=1 Tax=Salinicola sp. MH3R3-1 TaxID=1928762 RepID=UPI00143A37F2|nr:EF-hand domain-containing protein [Salinicola sp. MH3R3-1]
MREALAGKATDAEITKLVETLDANGDGLITLAEAQREATAGLPGAIAASLAPLFDSIDLNLDGVITFDEMRRALSGIASDDQLRQIFRTLDVNGDGQITRLEALRQSTDRTGDNTGDISGLTDRTLGQLASMDKHVRYDWREGITRRQRLTDIANVVESHLDDRWYGWQQSDNNHLTKAWREAISIRTQTTRVAEFMKKIYESPYTKFAKGGAFTNSVVSTPTTFDMGLMGEAGPEAIMPLSRGSDGSLGVRLDMPPLPVATGGNNNAQVEQLLRRLAQLTQENTELLKRLDAHGAAGVRVAQTGHQRSIQQLERIAGSNESMDDRERLGALS